MSEETPNRTIVAACYRSPVLALVALQGQEILEIRRHRMRSGGRRTNALRDRITRFHDDVGGTAVVTENASSLNPALRGAKLRLRHCDVKNAKARLTGRETAVHSDLARVVLDRAPHLSRFVGPTLRRRDSREVATMLAVALGFAAEFHGASAA